MLDAIRKKTDNLVFLILILAIVAVMALFGIGQLSSPSGGGGGAAAWVNGEMVTQQEFSQELRARLRQYQAILGAQYDEKLMLSLRLPQQTLEQLIQYKLISQQATRMDFIITDEELATHIRKIPDFQTNGKFDPALYRQIRGLGALERQQRERLRVVKLQNYMQNRIRLSPEEIRRAYQLAETKLDLNYAVIDFEALTKNYKPSKKAISTQLAPKNEPELKKYYSAHQGDFTDKARVKLRQIRAGIPFQASEEKKTAAREKITKVAKQLKSGNFAASAKKYSDDEYARKGGERGWVNNSTLSPAMERAADALEPGKISDVIETPGGFFLIEVLEKKPQKTSPFESVKGEIATILATSHYQETFAKEKQTKWNKILASGRSIAPQLRRLKVKIEKTGPFALNQEQIPKMGAVEKAMDAAFTLKKRGQVGKELFAHNKKFYFIELRSLTRPKKTEFKKKWEEVETSSQASLQNELFSQWLAAIRKSSKITQEVSFEGQKLPRL